MDPIERIIKEAQERGEFDNLAGAGKPQDLRENPWVPPDWQMAYRMLSSNGFAPDVVEEDKAIRAQIAALEQRADAFARRWHVLSPAAARQDRLSERERFIEDYMEEIHAINSRIHSFNAVAPVAMNRGTLRVAPSKEAIATRLPVA